MHDLKTVEIALNLYNSRLNFNMDVLYVLDIVYCHIVFIKNGFL